MTVLVTGATGCLGRHLVEGLVDSGVPDLATNPAHLEELGGDSVGDR